MTLVATIKQNVKTGKWVGIFMVVAGLLALLGVLHIIAGGYMASQPGVALAILTLFLAAFFVAEGIVEIVGAFGARPAEGWGWLLFGGIVSLLFGIMIWRQFPLSGVWSVGILVGVRLFPSGWALIAICPTVREAATEAGGQRSA